MLNDIDFANSLYSEYVKYSEPELTGRRFKQSDILPLLEKINRKTFEVKPLGKSFEGREIFVVNWGTGGKRVLCWSQMHGDEPTATMAIFDIFRFLSSDDKFNDIRRNVQKHLTLSFIPMLNPDGAEKFIRYNKAGIDINRDALKLVSPEAKLLHEYTLSFQPQFAFNLHDQDSRYTAGQCFKSAAVSFLAPPSDREKTISHTRLNAIKLISRLFKLLSFFIPGHIGKFNDEFEPRAFGDIIQKSGTSTILVESGGWKGDTEKQFLRKLNFILLLSAFRSISSESYKSEAVETYDDIPFNETFLFDVLLRNLKYRVNNELISVDIGINLEEKTCRDGRNYFYEAVIADIGDLSIYFGYTELNMPDYEVFPGLTAEKEYSALQDLNESELSSLHFRGITNVKIHQYDNVLEYSPLRLNLVYNSNYAQDTEIGIESFANLVFRKDGEVKLVMINGQMFAPDKPAEEFRNALLL